MQEERDAGGISQVVIVGYDGSACSKAALEVAVGQASRMPGARLVLVHAYEPPIVYPTPVGLEPPAALTTQIEDELRATRINAEQCLREGAELVAGSDLSVSTELREGSPADALLAAAKAHAACMIVVGTHGEGAIAGALLGSSVYRLLPKAHTPVLVVPLPE